MGERSGYSAGAIALGQSLVDVGSKISRIALVTPEVEEFNRKSLSKLWTVIEVEPIYCNHKLDPSITEHEYDLKGEQYLAGIQRWSATCTKFAAWKLIQFKRLVFFDSDMIALQPVDDVLYGFTNASFAAAPETFPPDTFNSGVMVLNPSLDTFEHLLELNEQVGSAEGGDQGVFNNGLCPNWYTAVHFAQYQTLRKMSGLRLPAMGHFVSDGKPWKVVAMEYMKVAIPPETQTELMKQKFLHVYWRLEFFKASGDAPPAVSFFGAEVDTLFSKTWRGD
ncbi:GYG1, partial [Symbiodinium microadriaticum]